MLIELAIAIAVAVLLGGQLQPLHQRGAGLLEVHLSGPLRAAQRGRHLSG